MQKSKTKRKNDYYNLIERDGVLCGICGGDLSQEISNLLPIFKRSAKNKPWRNDCNVDIDHIIPRSLGGDDTLENKQLTHRTCNGAKSNFFAGVKKPIPDQTHKWIKSLFSKTDKQV